MTRRSPRAGGSSQERPRLPGKEPGAYRATTMFVHFRETPYGLAMSLVENGRICHEHVASLGSIETPPSMAARIDKPHRTTKILGHARRRGDVAARGACAAAE